MGVSLARLDSLYKPDTFDDTLSAASITGLEGAAVDFADFQEGYLSQIKRILHGDDAGNWHDDIATEFARVGSLKSLASKTPLDEKLTLRWKLNTTNLTAVATDAQHILLDTADEPPSSVIAIATTVKGACSAQLSGAVDTAGLDEIAGSNPLSPKNLVAIFSADTGDPILSGGRRVWGLLQVGTDATDGNAFATSGDDLGQISFVRANSTYDDLELTPTGDMDAEVVIYAYSVRNDLDSTSEDEFRGGIAQADPVQGTTVTLDNAYDGGNYIAADASDIDFRLSDTVSFIVKKAGGNAMFTVIRTDTGTADEVIISSDVDTFDVNAAASDFANGVSIDSGTQVINVGKTASGVIDSASAELRANSSNAKISAASGDIQFVSSRQSALPLDDATAGPISGLTGGTHASISAAIAHAMTIGGADLELKLFTASSNYARDANVPAATFDLSDHSIDMNTISGVDTLIFLNGDLKIGGNVTTQNDVYVGTTAADGDLKFDLAKGIHNGDVILSVSLQQ